MVILNKFVVVVVVVDFFRLDIILHFRDRAFCTLTTFYYRDGTFSSLIPFYYRNVTFCILISFYCRDRTFSTLISFYNRCVTFSSLISFYYRDVTFSTLILSYYPHVTFSTLKPSYYRDETFFTSISFFYRNVTFPTLISFYCRDGTFVPWSHFTTVMEHFLHWYLVWSKNIGGRGAGPPGPSPGFATVDVILLLWCDILYLDIITRTPWWNIVCLDSDFSAVMYQTLWLLGGAFFRIFILFLLDRDQNLSLLSGRA